MSELIPKNNSTSSFLIEKNEIDKNASRKTKEKSEEINPISLLSKDLLEKINSLDEKDFESKKDKKINDNMQLDETHKDSEENEEDDEDDYILEIGKENKKNMFSFEIFKNEKNDNSNEDKIKQKENEKDIRLIITIILIMAALRIQIFIIPWIDLVMTVHIFKIETNFLIVNLIIK